MAKKLTRWQAAEIIGISDRSMRGVHRKRRPRWFQDERWAGFRTSAGNDLIVILDDANSEIYYAQLVEEESTAQRLPWTAATTGAIIPLAP